MAISWIIWGSRRKPRYLDSSAPALQVAMMVRYRRTSRRCDKDERRGDIYSKWEQGEETCESAKKSPESSARKRGWKRLASNTYANSLQTSQAVLGIPRAIRIPLFLLIAGVTFIHKHRWLEICFTELHISHLRVYTAEQVFNLNKRRPAASWGAIDENNIPNA